MIRFITANMKVLEWVYLETKADYLVGQLERGTEGTVHLQFFVHYARCVRITHITKKFPSVHCEKVKRDNGASSYCMKEATRVPDRCRPGFVSMSLRSYNTQRSGETNPGISINYLNYRLSRSSGKSISRSSA